MPKLVFILAWLSIYSSVNAQNPFINGIQSVEQAEYKDGDKKNTFLKFRYESKDDCSAIYSYTEMDFDKGIERTFENTVSWKWGEISSIEKDSVKNILRLNSSQNMPLKRIEQGIAGVSEQPYNNTVNIYFKDIYQLNAAIDWVLTHVKTCGGKATLIQ